MTRVYQNTPLVVGNSLTLDENASHHLARVLRVAVKDELIVFNGKGGEYSAVITAIQKKTVTVTLTQFHAREAESPIHIYLAQGIARGEKMDFIIQKAVELGAAKIFPLITERVTVRLEGDREAKRREHWQAVVVSACEQSGRTRLADIAPPQRYADFLQQVKADHAFVLSPHVAGKMEGVRVDQGQSMIVLIGPEGGLSDAEVSQAIQQGYQPLNLGSRVLRTETATLVALTVLQHRFGDL